MNNACKIYVIQTFPGCFQRCFIALKTWTMTMFTHVYPKGSEVYGELRFNQGPAPAPEFVPAGYMQNTEGDWVGLPCCLSFLP